MKTVKVSDKGQIAIPVDIREEAGIERGDELVILESNGKILLEKSEIISTKMEDDFKDLLKASEMSLAKDWLSPEDEEAWKDL